MYRTFIDLYVGDSSDCRSVCLLSKVDPFLPPLLGVRVRLVPAMQKKVDRLLAFAKARDMVMGSWVTYPPDYPYSPFGA
jgi:hypothetical protein